MIRYIVRNIDGKYAVHKENTIIANYCDTQEAALKLARKLAAETSDGIERTEQLAGGGIAIWREAPRLPDPTDQS